MRYSKLFGKTIREIPKDIYLTSHQLLYKAGFIRELVAGRYFLTNLGYRVVNKIVGIIDEEMAIINLSVKDSAIVYSITRISPF